jgi:tetratricopeptide (TPR) repeat protein
MKIIRWLLSHIFLILLIIVVIYGYMFWGNLAGDDTPAGKAIAYLSEEFVEVEEFVDAIKAKQAELAGENTATSKTATSKDVKTSAIAEPVLQNSATNTPLAQRKDVPTASSRGSEQTDTGQQPASISYSHEQTKLQQNSAGEIESMAPAQAGVQNLAVAESTQTAKTAVATSPATEKYVPAEVEQQLSNVDQHGNLIDTPQNSDSVKQSWITARKSFYQRNYEKSIDSYKEVIENTKDNFDAYGELGNVYFNQGKNEQAAAAYFEAAAILIRKGQVRRAQSLMGLMRHLDKAKASELQALIDSAASS